MKRDQHRAGHRRLPAACGAPEGGQLCERRAFRPPRPAPHRCAPVRLELCWESAYRMTSRSRPARSRPRQSSPLGGEPRPLAALAAATVKGRCRSTTTGILFFLRRQVRGAEQGRRAGHVLQQANLLGALFAADAGAARSSPSDGRRARRERRATHHPRALIFRFGVGHTPVVGAPCDFSPDQARWIGCSTRQSVALVGRSSRNGCDSLAQGCSSGRPRGLAQSGSAPG